MGGPGGKVVQLLSDEPVTKKEEITKYYPRHQETHKLVMALRDYGLFRDEHQDFKEELERQNILRGKLPFSPRDKRLAGKAKAK